MVSSVGFSPDDKRVVSGSDDKTVRVWDVDSDEVVAGPFEGHVNSVTSVGFSLDGKRVVSGSGDKTVRVWDVGSDNIVGNVFEGLMEADLQSTSFSGWERRRTNFSGRKY